jgi:hypothetical protein
VKRTVASALLVSLLLATASPLHAEPSAADRTLAEALFRDGRKLLAEGKVAEACAKFGESQRIAPALGTLLNLAACHEKEGKLATAWGEFMTVVTQAVRVGDSEREAFARERLEAIETHLPKLVVVAETIPDGLEVRLDGTAMSAAALGSPLPLDPGPHEVTATAPQRMVWSQRFDIPAAAITTTLKIPTLAPVGAATPQPARDESTPTSTKRTIGYVALGVGFVGLGVGTFFGLRALSKKSEANRDCVDKQCDAEGLARIDEAKTAATWSTVSLGIGLVGLVGGVYLVLSSSSGASSSSGSAKPASSRGFVVSPLAGADGGGLSVSARF